MVEWDWRGFRVGEYDGVMGIREKGEWCGLELFVELVEDYISEEGS